MALVTTLPELYRPLMGVPTVKTSRCVVCGRPGPLNEHRLVGPSLGRLAAGGGFAEPPTVTLCGAGNALYVADPAGGRFMACNGKAHHKLLHFRAGAGGRLEYLELDEPAPYAEALGLPGWRPIDPQVGMFGLPSPARRPPALGPGWASDGEGGELSGEEARRRLREILGVDAP